MIKLDLARAGSQLVGALRVLRQRAPLILLCTIVTALAAFGFSSGQAHEYTATADVLFTNQQLAQQAAGLQVVPTSNPQPDQDTDLKLATLPRVASETAAALGHGLTAREVASNVSVGSRSATRTRQCVGDLDVSLVRARHSRTPTRGKSSPTARRLTRLLRQRPQRRQSSI